MLAVLGPVFLSGWIDNPVLASSLLPLVILLPVVLIVNAGSSSVWDSRIVWVSPRDQASHKAPDLPMAAILTFGLVLCLNAVFSVAPRVSFLGGHYRGEGFVLVAGLSTWALVASRALAPGGGWMRVATAITGIALLVSLIAVYEAASDRAFSLTARIEGPFGNPIVLGAFLFSTMP